jgi:hypothetical protein
MMPNTIVWSPLNPFVEYAIVPANVGRVDAYFNSLSLLYVDIKKFNVGTGNETNYKTINPAGGFPVTRVDTTGSAGGTILHIYCKVADGSPMGQVIPLVPFPGPPPPPTAPASYQYVGIGDDGSQVIIVLSNNPAGGGPAATIADAIEAAKEAGRIAQQAREIAIKAYMRRRR